MSSGDRRFGHQYFGLPSPRKIDADGVSRHPTSLPKMKSAQFLVIGRPRLSAIKRFPAVEFADYERRLADMQEALQRVQQAYLGTAHRAIVVLEGWDTAGKGGVVRRLGWALDPRSFKVHAITAP